MRFSLPFFSRIHAGGFALGVCPTQVRQTPRDGRRLSCTPTSVAGDPKNPVDQRLLEAKFRDCVSFSAKPISARNIDRVIELIGDLEHPADVTEITKLFA